jgi:uncharacterized membrane protein
VQNPYAPPRDFGMLQGSLGPPGSPRGFETREVLEAAWQIVKVHWPLLVAAVVVWSVPGGLAGSVPTLAVLFKVVEEGSAEYWGIYAGSTLASQTIGTFFQVGFLRISLAAARGQTPEFMTIFSGFDRFLPLLIANLLYYFSMTFGMLLFIVPGVILFLGFSLAPFYCIDARLGPFAALGESWRAMRGHKGQMFIFLCASFAIYLLGMLACCVGALPAGALLYVAWAIIYVRLSGYERAPYGSEGA